MEDSATIEKKISRSEAFKSLRSEMKVAECLERYGWNVRHSPYYIDPKTGKAREIDVTGSAYWNKPLKSGQLSVRVNLFVEVKSNSDFHILCAGPSGKQSSFNANEHWLGYSEETMDRIESSLHNFNLNFDSVKKILHHVEKIAFPRSTMRTSSLRIAPPPATALFSAFRETNGSGEKDLDNSVLWRAVQALRSAVQGSQADLIDALESDLETDLEAARRTKEPIERALFSVESHACRLNLYLPIVVLQSRIWSAHADEPHELKWVRLVQYDTFGGTSGWVDVVNDRHFEQYIHEISKHFVSAFTKARAVRQM